MIILLLLLWLGGDGERGEDWRRGLRRRGGASGEKEGHQRHQARGEGHHHMRGIGHQSHNTRPHKCTGFW